MRIGVAELRLTPSVCALCEAPSGLLGLWRNGSVGGDAGESQLGDSSEGLNKYLSSKNPSRFSDALKFK